jgi:predicted XRE-type DNA-binding protein
MEADVLNEIHIRTECLIEMYELIEQNQLGKVDQAHVEVLLHRFRAKSNELKGLVSNKFKEMKASLKLQEQHVESVLKKNIAFIEQ